MFEMLMIEAKNHSSNDAEYWKFTSAEQVMTMKCCIFKYSVFWRLYTLELLLHPLHPGTPCHLGRFRQAQGMLGTVTEGARLSQLLAKMMSENLFWCYGS